MRLPYRVLDERAATPRNAYGMDAGWDLMAIENKLVAPGVIVDVRTGIAIDLPDGYFARIVHRSSTARKKKIMVIEATIDTGYQGELLIGCYLVPGFSEHGMYGVTAGDVIAQLIVQRVEPVVWDLVDNFRPSIRGERGMGSSDIDRAADVGWPYLGEDAV